MLPKILVALFALLNSFSFPPRSVPSFQPPPVTLDQIFDSDLAWTATLSAQKLTTIVAVGDIMPARTITARNPSSDFSYLYAQVKDLLASDLTVANLETPVISACKPFTDGMRFCLPPVHLPALKNAGFTVLGLANNHVYDYYEPGFAESLSHIQASGMQAIQPNKPLYLTVNGQVLALIAVNFIPGFRNITPATDQLTTLVADASASADLVIVFPHWGTEYTFTPSRHQQTLARQLIDAGADLVLGSHPHWLQPLEIYHDKLIVYSHGNFVFDQYWSDATRRGLIGKYIFYDHRLIDVHFTPVYIGLTGAPAPASPQQAASWLSGMASGSRD